MTLNPVNPIEIQRREGQPSARRSSSARGMEFGDFLGGVSAMTPFATEFTRQSTGSVNAATVLNAAFTSFPGAASSFAGGTAPSWALASGMGPGYWGGAGQMYGMPNLGGSYPSQQGLVSGSAQAVPGTNLSQFQLMEIMNQNNLRLIELQALMQSNMQVWNTKSNILSADHRAKLSMIEKFTARG